MSTAAEQYRKAKRELRDAEKLIELIGKPYNGGGGGVGEIRNISLGMTIYHQAYDGANNYHSASGELLGALSTAAMSMSRELIAKAMEILRSRVAQLASLAADELKEVIADADRVQ